MNTKKKAKYKLISQRIEGKWKEKSMSQKKQKRIRKSKKEEKMIWQKKDYEEVEWKTSQ